MSAKSSTKSKESKPPPERMRNITMTINNYLEEDINMLKSLNYKYLIFGKEVSKSKTKHLQVYCQLKNTTTFSALQKKFPKAHIEPAKEDASFNVDYCKKEGKFEEFGEIKAQGKRTDLDRIRQLALTGGMRAVTRVGSHAEIKVAEAYLTYNEEPRDWKPNVFWIYGPAGVGKSRLAKCILEGTTGADPSHNTFIVVPTPEDDISDPYTKGDPSKWWNGYDAHPNVIIDDFRHSWWPLTYLLNLLDRSSFQVEIKGGMRQFRARNIIITSIAAPDAVYTKASGGQMVDANGEPSNQLLRRIDEIIKLDYTYDDKDKYIMDKAAYINSKLHKHLKYGRKETVGIVDFNDKIPKDFEV